MVITSYTMFISLGLALLLLSCLSNVIGYPVSTSRGFLLFVKNLPDSEPELEITRRINQFLPPDPTATLICKVLHKGAKNQLTDEVSSPSFYLGETELYLRRRNEPSFQIAAPAGLFGYPAQMEIEPWELLAYTPNGNLAEPDVTTLLAAPAPVLCVSPDRPRPHPVLLSPEAPRPIALAPPPFPRPAAVLSIGAAAPAPFGLPVEPSINPAIIDSILNGVYNRPSALGVSDNGVGLAPLGPTNAYKPHSNYPKLEQNPEASPSPSTTSTAQAASSTKAEAPHQNKNEAIEN